MKSALVVEDIASVAQSLAESLMRVFPGIEVLFATTLADAIQQVNQLLPDIILLDLTLPDGSGLAVLDGLREAAPNLLTYLGVASLIGIVWLSRMK